MNNKFHINNIYFILIILIIKILFGFYLKNTNPDFFYTTDSYEYINSAKQICENQKFNDINNDPEIKRTPGTSFLLLPAVCLDLDLVSYTFLLNILMVLLSAYFTYKIVRLLDIKVKYQLIFLIYLIDPTLSKHQYNILSDILFLFWFTLALYFFIYGLKKNNFYCLFFGFFFITVGTFVRPITIYLPYCLSIFFILFYFFNSSFRKKFRYPIIIATLLGLIVHLTLTQLWTNRNYQTTGIKEFTYIKVLNDYLYKTAGIIAKKQKRNFLDVHKEFKYNVEKFSKKEFIIFSNNEVKKAIINYPFETIMLGIEGAIMTLFTPGTGQYARMFNISEKNYDFSRNIFIGIGLIWIIIMGIFAILGIIKIDKNIFFLIVALIFLYLLVASSGPMSYSRFRIPFMPLIVILITCGFQSYRSKWFSKL